MTNVEKQRLDAFLTEMARTTGAKVLDLREEVPYENEEGHTARMDAVVDVKLRNGDVVELAVEVLKAGYPRDIRLAALRLQDFERAGDGHSRPLKRVVVAEHLSSGARDDLRKHGYCYYDSTGTLLFESGDVLVDIDREPRPANRRRADNLFTAAREQVVHALLHHWWSNGAEFVSGAELAKLAETSVYTVSLVMQELERQDWVQTQGLGPHQRRRLTDAAGLLDAWAAAWTSRRETRTRWFAFTQKGGPTDYALWRLREREDWALTGPAAANAVMPHLTNVERIDIVIKPGQAQEIAQVLEVKPAEKGSNVVLVERSGLASWLFREEHPERPGSQFTSRFIQYLDLLNGVGRNKELAREYRRAVLKIEERGDDE